MAQVVLDRILTEVEWEALEDPVDGRYEVLDGRLVMSPSANADHNDLNLDLVMMLRDAVRDAGLDLRVTTDVEWRTVVDGVVVEAPRGDVVVGSVDSVRRIHDAVPLLVCEVWSDGTRPGVIDARRSYWQRIGLRHYWEIQLGETEADTTLHAWNLSTSAEPRLAAGSQPVVLTDPFPIEIVSSELHGWAEARTEAANVRVDELEAEIARLADRLRDLGEDV